MKKNSNIFFWGRTGGLSACSRLASAQPNIAPKGASYRSLFWSVSVGASDIGELPLQSLAQSALCKKQHHNKN